MQAQNASYIRSITILLLSRGYGTRRRSVHTAPNYIIYWISHFIWSGRMYWIYHTGTHFLLILLDTALPRHHFNCLADGGVPYLLVYVDGYSTNTNP
jgi:hypothetical protein